MKHIQEIEEVLFEAALLIDSPEARQVFLELLRDGDYSQSTRLGEMLEARSDADRFFSRAEDSRSLLAAEAGEDLIGSPNEKTLLDQLGNLGDEAPGEQIGRYRLLQRIGEGGCGVVYLADQLEPVQRQVALKVIRLGMDTEQVIARFEMERQALAMMDHPNIARVLDAGATDAGRPFFVMEWVRGLRITDYCDDNHLDIRQRLYLFIEASKAIQHAHQKGVVHRDIKPSNILISEENSKPVVKVIDFGVAKAIEAAAGDDTALTLYDQFVGTPAYMSPEQADHKQDVDTRSDVYSLGILLYELLAGRTPFDSKELASVGLTEMRKILTEREPPPPSLSLSAAGPEDLKKIASDRAIDPSKLRALLKGDLDSVVMKAIEKDRPRRYETVNGLIMDLQRFIAHEPVIARPAKRMYLFHKFVRRNRVAVGAFAGIVLSLLLGLGTAFSYYMREREAREEQVRLRQIAETAHVRELQRLVEAREWENFAHISVLLSEGRTKEADEQLRQTPLTSIKLTPQSSAVLRSLGNWNALRGRWQQAVECFQMLLRSDELAPGQRLMTSHDMIAIGCAFVEGARPDEYQAFCEWAFDQFKKSPSPAEVSRLYHSVLLLPADAGFLAKLHRLKPILEESKSNPQGIEYPVWRAFGLALLEYRQGNFERARNWAEVGIGLKSNRAHIDGAFEPIHAMACFRLGDVKTATADLARTRKRIDKAFSPELPAAYEPFGRSYGFWWDWVIVRILFREAETLIQAPAVD
ncbi:MAG: serine/threonine-protein kinase [Verrucomicrobiota bacterium]